MQLEEHNQEKKAEASCPFGFVFRFTRTAFLAALIVFAVVNLGLKNCNLQCQSQAKLGTSLEEVLQADSGNTSNPFCWWIANAYLKEKTAPDVVVFGSSQMGSAMATADAQYLFQLVDVVIHRHIVFLEDELKKKFTTAKTINVLSLSSPGSMVSDSYMMSRALFSEGKKPKLAIISISPRDFIDNTLPSPAATEQFKYLSRFVDVTGVENFAYTDPFARLDFQLNKLPLRLLGLQWQLAGKTNAAEQPQLTAAATKDVLQSIKAGASFVKPGQWVVPANLPPIWADNSKEYVSRFKNPNSPNYKAEMGFFAQWLKDLQAQNIQVLVVGMPSLPMNRALLPGSFWTRFRQDVATACSTSSANWLDLTDSQAFSRPDYLDTVHLNAHGGFKLFRIIVQDLSTKNGIASVFDRKAMPNSVDQCSVAVKAKQGKSL